MNEVVDFKDRTREKKIEEVNKKKNWVYYMQEGLKAMWKLNSKSKWKKKEVSDEISEKIKWYLKK